MVFGAKVTVEGEDGKPQTYQIVGQDEADIKVGKISLTAPIARALIGKRLGDIVEVKLPRQGVKELEITAVAFE